MLNRIPACIEQDNTGDSLPPLEWNLLIAFTLEVAADVRRWIGDGGKPGLAGIRADVVEFSAFAGLGLVL